jgi:hypothetical protein
MLVLSDNPDGPLARTRIVELTGEVCVVVEAFGAEPHAPIAAHITPNKKMLSARE